MAKKNSSGENQLSDIKGVGKARAKKLKQAGLDTPAAVASASASQLEEAGISGATAKKLKQAARKLAGPSEQASGSKGKSLRITEDSPPVAPQSPSNWKRVGIAALVVLVVAIGVIVATGTPFGFGGSSSQPAAAVNGEVVTQSELDTQYASLPAQLQQQYSKEDVLSQLVDKQLILQYADDQGVSVSDADVEARIDEQVEQLGVSRDELTQVLAGGNVTLAQYRTAVREELVLQALLADIEADVSVSDEEVRSAYEQLPEENRSEFEAVESQLRDALAQRAAQQAFGQLIDQLRAQADIDYYGPYQSLAE